MNIAKSHSRGFIKILLLIPFLAGGAFAQHYVPNFNTKASGDPITTGSFIAEQYAAWGMHIS